jgi:hypothetical protein
MAGETIVTAEYRMGENVLFVETEEDCVKFSVQGRHDHWTDVRIRAPLSRAQVESLVEDLQEWLGGEDDEE